MKRSHALALSAMTLFLATSASVQAQMPRSGQQCQPAVANASMYGNCRLRIVRGEEVCRCAILPRALRNVNRMDDGRVSSTGAISPTGPRAGAPAFGGPVTGRPAADWRGATTGRLIRITPSHQRRYAEQAAAHAEALSEWNSAA